MSFSSTSPCLTVHAKHRLTGSHCVDSSTIHVVSPPVFILPMFAGSGAIEQKTQSATPVQHRTTPSVLLFHLLHFIFITHSIIFIVGSPKTSSSSNRLHPPHFAFLISVASSTINVVSTFLPPFHVIIFGSLASCHLLFHVPEVFVEFADASTLILAMKRNCKEKDVSTRKLLQDSL
jgi:hypothetical protein